MRNLLEPKYYSSPEIFSVEQDRLFRNAWIFVAFRDDLRNNNDFIRCCVGGIDIVVQSFDGELVAFVNACSHRFNLLQCEESGNRPLICQYHGWRFNRDGKPTGIPSRPRFDNLSEAVLEQLCLKKWRVECCGSLVFVCETTTGPSLRDYLGNAYDTVARISNACGKRIDDNRLTIEANWKVTVENTLESYHVAFIHPKSFATLGVSEGCFDWQKNHSSWATMLSPEVDSKMKKFMPLVEDRPAKFTGYYHQLIFPNLTLATTYGTTFSIQFFEPVGPTMTQFRSLVFETATANESSTGRQAIEVLGRMAIDFNRRVFLEDKVICETVQRGAMSAVGPGILSDEEMRVGKFQEEYLKFMGDERS